MLKSADQESVERTSRRKLGITPHCWEYYPIGFPLSLIVKNDSESDNESGVESHDKMMIMRVRKMMMRPMVKLMLKGFVRKFNGFDQFDRR